MKLRCLLDGCILSYSNVERVRVVGVTSDVRKKFPSSKNPYIVGIQKLISNEALSDCDVSQFGIDDAHTLFVEIC